MVGRWVSVGRWVRQRHREPILFEDLPKETILKNQLIYIFVPTDKKSSWILNAKMTIRAPTEINHLLFNNPQATKLILKQVSTYFADTWKSIISII